MHIDLPILYSFRRCPYAIRARLALALSEIAYELREISLASKPAALLACSPKGTVPVLVLANGEVIDESADIVAWAILHSHTDNWALAAQIDTQQAAAMTTELHACFIPSLNRFKYPQRYTAVNMQQEQTILNQFLISLNGVLSQQSYLSATRASLIDMLVFPFIRQCRLANTPWFDALPTPFIQDWLQAWIEHPLFKQIMTKQPLWHDEIT
jgi:glutathione S-transferase